MSALEYPVTRKYTIPHLTPYFSVFSVVAIVAFAVLNVVLQGYDVVTVLRPDPNVTASYWWSTSKVSVRSAGDCNPVSLSKEMTFSTNSSLFSYTLRSTFSSNKRNVAGASSYMANPLSSCTVDGIVTTVDLGSRTFDFDIPILCLGSDLPFSLSLISTFSLNQKNQYYDDIVAHYIQNKPSSEGLELGLSGLLNKNASDPLNTIGILDAISADLIMALDTISATSVGMIPTKISTGGLLSCPGGPNATCPAEDRRMIIPASGATYPNGSYIVADGIGAFLAPIETSFLNMFIVLQDAYHIDFGNIQPSNTILNKAAFSARIQPDTTISKSMQAHPDYRNCGWGIGCVYNTSWVDHLLAPNSNLSVVVPSILASGNAPAVVGVDYLCPQFRIKRPGSLVTSVFIGTWSMYMALFGAFGFIGPILEKRYGRKNEVESTFESGLGYEPAAKDGKL